VNYSWRQLTKFDRSVKFLLAIASTVIPGFVLLEINDQDFYFLLNVYLFRNGASSALTAVAR
jgi:hypothetical protein